MTWPYKSRNLKVERIEIPGGRSTLTCAVVTESHPQLIQVQYPGLVENPDRAVRTLGGIHKISETFDIPKKKLELRFRPTDFYCNAAYGEPAVTCGILIKLRRRKSAVAMQETTPPPDPPTLIDLTNLTSPTSSPTTMSEDLVPDVEVAITESSPLTELEVFKRSKKEGKIFVFNGPLPEEFRKQMNEDDEKTEKEDGSTNAATDSSTKQPLAPTDSILLEEHRFLEKLTLEKQVDRIIDEGSFFTPHFGSSGNKSRIYVKVPYHLSQLRAVRSNYHVEVLGIIPKRYKFQGMCDFQYLPMKKLKKRYVSILNKLIPVFPNPDKPSTPLKDLIVCDVKRIGHGKNMPQFVVPAIMSRVDKPLANLGSFLEEGILRDANLKHRHILQNTRTRRVVYSNLCNFRASDDRINSPDCLVPKCPVKEAINDAEKRGLLGLQFATVKELFETRPIWTKIALDYRTNYGFFALKYLLPCVAYFALNGPWRSCWIRFGFDPRKDKSAYVYQLLDYRVPYCYRGMMANRKKNSTIEVDRETLFNYKLSTMPPKCQMIYQFCEIQIKEIEELNRILQNRLSRNEAMNFDAKFGFLNEDIVEYCRYCISRNVELFLLSTGQIHKMTLPEITLLPDGSIPKEVYIKAVVTKSSSRSLRGVKRKPRPRLAPFTLDAVDEVSNQSSSLGDLTITNDFQEEELASEVESDNDEDLILDEVIDATTVAHLEADENGSAEEEDINGDNVNQILGLEYNLTPVRD